MKFLQEKLSEDEPFLIERVKYIEIGSCCKSNVIREVMNVNI